MLKVTRRPLLNSIALAAAAMLLIGAPARAGFSPVNAPSSADEIGHADILSHAYGGTFVSTGGVNFTNGSMTAMRLDDSDASDMNLFTGTGSDQCWANGVVSIRALARYAGYQQELGYLDGETGGAFHSLFTITGTGMNVAGSVENLDMTGKEFRFARGGGVAHGEMFTSLDLDNAGAADQMVSYKLTGPSGLTKYLLFFEDVGASQDSDWDYNDMVVEVTAASPSHTAVPLPPTVWSGMAMMVAGGIWSGRVRIKNWLS